MLRRQQLLPLIIIVFLSNELMKPHTGQRGQCFCLCADRTGETDEDREPVCNVAAEVSTVQHAHLSK